MSTEIEITEDEPAQESEHNQAVAEGAAAARADQATDAARNASAAADDAATAGAQAEAAAEGAAEAAGAAVEAAAVVATTEERILAAIEEQTIMLQSALAEMKTVSTTPPVPTTPVKTKVDKPPAERGRKSIAERYFGR